MSAVTRILAAIEQGDARAAEQLWPLVYDELRRLERLFSPLGVEEVQGRCLALVWRPFEAEEKTLGFAYPVLYTSAVERDVQARVRRGMIR